MKQGWDYRKFESCLVRVPKQRHINKKKYKSTGKFPIVSQESDLISGYWDDETIVYKHVKPVVIFGDHTKNIKFINFDFVVGADGTHILSTKSDIDVKYFYYALKSIVLRDLGYARHYKLLKEKYIPIPQITEQLSIVEYLDSAFAKIDAMKTNAQKALDEAKALFQVSLKEMLKPKEDWGYRKFESCLVRVPKQRQINKKEYKSVGRFPIVSQESELISGYWNDENILYRHEKPIVIFGDHTKIIKYIDFDFVVGADGTHILSTKSDINVKFFYYALKSIVLRDLGYARHYKLLKEKYISIPPLPEQQRIVAALDSIKSKVDRLQANFGKISSECDALKQAILREVFEGELSPGRCGVSPQKG